MIIKAKIYRKFKQNYRAKQYIPLTFAQAFIKRFNLKSQDLGDIRLDLTVLSGMQDTEAKQRIEYQLIDWNKDL